MLVRKFSIVVATVAAMTASAALAQKGAASKPAPAANAAAQVSAAIPDGGMPQFVRPETPEQRLARLGTAEDPGLDPDPSKHFWRFGKSFRILKFERRLAVYDAQDGNYVRPLGMVNFPYEIYQQNDQYVWCWMPDIDPTQMKEEVAAKAPSAPRFTKEDIAYFVQVRPQFTALTPPDSGKTISFVESSDGLPQGGSWRNSLTVADMNGDGFPDLITPPERKGNGSPQIFLGDGKGRWRTWTSVRWPHTLDYGGVAAADVNKDGHMDLAFAVHLNGIYVFLGDGKGTFTESTEGLPRDFPTRRVVMADVDGDRLPDIIASHEGPTALDTERPYGKVRVYLNRKKGMAWEGVDVVDPETKIGGDWLSVGNFNADRYPDFIASSVFFSATQVVHLSDGPKKWNVLVTDGDTIPAHSYFLASTVGKFARASDEAIISYARFWPTELDTRTVATPPITELTNIDRLVFTKSGLKRIPIMRWSGHAGVHGVASADFNGDGKLDVIFTREEPEQREAVILLGDGKGNFTRLRVEGLTIAENNLYDIKVADLNRDGRPDVIVMYESMEIRRQDFLRITEKNQAGSIKVFLNRGVKSAAEMKASK